MGNIAENIKQIRQRMEKAAIRAGRDPASIKLVAVTKTATIDQIREAYDSGLRDFGENRVQPAAQKIALLQGCPDIKWHMIGHLQTNKVKQALELFGIIHSVDSLKLAIEIDKKAREKGVKIPVLVEVNIAGEESKYGITPGEAPQLLKDIAGLEGLEAKGLMTMAPFSDDPEKSRTHFKILRVMGEALELKELSMGMTGDYEVAIEEGSTIIRVGTGIFG